MRYMLRLGWMWGKKQHNTCNRLCVDCPSAIGHRKVAQAWLGSRWGSQGQREPLTSFTHGPGDQGLAVLLALLSVSVPTGLLVEVILRHRRQAPPPPVCAPDLARRAHASLDVMGPEYGEVSQ